jgi:UDP-glucose 4-epimerase
VKDGGLRILVTGGAGFVGSHLVKRLLQLGSKIGVLDNLSSGSRSNIPEGSVEFVEGDVRDVGLVERLVQKTDLVFHLAEFIPDTKSAGPGHVVKYSVEHPLQEFEVSCTGTLNVLEACRKNDKGIVFTSTAAVYGQCETGRVREDAPINPLSPYGASKACAEMYVRLYWKVYNLPTRVARLFNVYGPGQHKYLMYDTLAKIETHPAKLEVLGSGMEERDFIYVDDVVDALLLLADREGIDGECFNVGAGTGTSVKRTVELILETLGEQIPLTFTQKSWKGDVSRLVAYTSKISQIGFEPKHDLPTGLKQFVQWYRSEGATQSFRKLPA